MIRETRVCVLMGCYVIRETRVMYLAIGRVYV